MATEGHCRIHVQGGGLTCSGAAGDSGATVKIDGGRNGFSALTITFAVIGLILLIASALKSYELATADAAFVGRRWFQFALATFEACFGL